MVDKRPEAVAAAAAEKQRRGSKWREDRDRFTHACELPLYMTVGANLLEGGSG